MNIFRLFRFLSLSLIGALLFGGLSPYPVTAAEPNSVRADGLSETLYLPSVSRRTPSCVSLAQPNMFGVQMYGNTGSQSPYYDSMTGAGGDWVRVQVKWSNVEEQNTTPPSYDWRTADVAVAAATDACKQVIITHVSAPGWAADSPNSVINSENLDDFEEYIGDLAERYDGDGVADAPGSPVVNYWEIYNEPDNAPGIGFDGWGDNPEEYAAMLKLAYAAIHAHNSQAKVLFGGLAYDNFVDNGGHFVRSFLDKVLKVIRNDKNDRDKYFDIFNFHSYPLFGPDWIIEMNPDSACAQSGACGPGLLEKSQYLQDKLKSYGLAGQPVIITEAGWHSDPAPDLPSTPEIQARYVTELFVQSKAAGVQAMIYFALATPDSYPYDAGLITRDSPPQKKKSYKAYKAAVDWLADATFVRRLTDSEMKAPEMDGYKFLSPQGRTFYVAWLNPAKMGFDLDGDGEADVAESFESLRLPGNEAKVYDIYGNLVETVTDTDGDVKVMIGGQPRYIEITQ